MTSAVLKLRDRLHFFVAYVLLMETWVFGFQITLSYCSDQSSSSVRKIKYMYLNYFEKMKPNLKDVFD